MNVWYFEDIIKVHAHSNHYLHNIATTNATRSLNLLLNLNFDITQSNTIEIAYEDGINKSEIFNRLSSQSPIVNDFKSHTGLIILFCG